MKTDLAGSLRRQRTREQGWRERESRKKRNLRGVVQAGRGFLDKAVPTAWRKRLQRMRRSGCAATTGLSTNGQAFKNEARKYEEAVIMR